VLELKTELLQEQEEEGGNRRGQPAGDVRVEEDELPLTRLLRELEPARISLASSGVVHPKRWRTASSCS
jgi:hypothetical protein